MFGIFEPPHRRVRDEREIRYFFRNMETRRPISCRSAPAITACQRETGVTGGDWPARPGDGKTHRRAHWKRAELSLVPL